MTYNPIKNPFFKNIGMHGGISGDDDVAKRKDILKNRQDQAMKKLKKLRKSYRQNLIAQVKELMEIWEGRRLHPMHQVLNELYSLAHKIAGTSGVYGFDDVGNSAKKMQHMIKDYTEHHTIDLNPFIEKMDDYLHKIWFHANVKTDNHKNWDAWLGNIIQKSKSGMAAFDMAHHGADDDASVEEGGNPVQYTRRFNKTDKPVLLLCAPGQKDADDIIHQMRYYGYTSEKVELLPGDYTSFLEDTLKQKQPLAILVDMDYVLLEAINSLHRLLSDYPAAIPLIFISRKDKLESRIQAVRLGGSYYATKPIEFGRLVDKLDQLTHRFITQPYRVLILDDDDYMVQFTEALLSKAGMQTMKITKPMELFDAMQSFRPDLLIMDLYMPDCNGFELASVIRQKDAYIGLPIIFLSSETSHSKQMEAMQLGGDEFLTKPIDPQRLIEAVSIRVERLRHIRSFMIKDSLTGLLNHRAIHDHLSRLYAETKRRESNMAFILLDIDHFKNVNDQYGHVMGDRVLKSLSRFLMDRLRTQDVVGRYGGEEFVVLMPNTDAKKAHFVMDQIRKDFGEIVHQDPLDKKCQFKTSFSAGIADQSQVNLEKNLKVKADEALYKAKENGRNQIHIYDGNS